MRRYRARLAFDEVWQDPPPPASVSVFEPEPGAVFTGLYDQYGVPIYATEDRPPIGFWLGGDSA